MRTIAIPILLVLELTVAAAALAGHTEPARANRMQFELVNGFIECDGSNVNTATQSNGTPACAPASPASGLCAFAPQGSGKLTISKTGTATQGNQDLKISVAAKGLDCEGGQLRVRLSFRLTTDDCPEGSCTTVDVHDFDLNGAFCLVADGKCKIKTTLNTVAPGFIATNGKNAGIVILGCGLKEFAFPIFPADLQCGLLLK